MQTLRACAAKFSAKGQTLEGPPAPATALASAEASNAPQHDSMVPPGTQPHLPALTTKASQTRNRTDACALGPASYNYVRTKTEPCPPLGCVERGLTDGEEGIRRREERRERGEIAGRAFSPAARDCKAIPVRFAQKWRDDRALCCHSPGRNTCVCTCVFTLIRVTAFVGWRGCP